MAFASVYVRAAAPSCDTYDDVATEPPYVPTCGECRWCKDLGVSGDHGVCVRRFEQTWSYDDMKVVNFDDCACADMEG